MKLFCLQSIGSAIAAAVCCALPVGSAHAQFASWSAQPGVKALAGDFDGDKASDILLTGGAGWTSLPVAFSNRDGSFRVTNAFVGDFGTWATWAGVKTLVGDFNGDRRSDLALIGPSGWNSMPVAFSNGDGSFRITNTGVGDFAGWASAANVDALVGDFDGDGKADVALAGGDPAWWHTMPVAFSRKGGTFKITNTEAGIFAVRAGEVGTKKVAGDFDGDGKADLAVVGSSSRTMAVAFSRGKGVFEIRDQAIGEFAAWAAAPGVKVLVGDFNGDHRSDIALIGGDPNWWSTVPVAFSNGDGSFTVTNFQAYFDGGNLSALAAHGAATVFAGDANGDGLADISVVSAGTFVYTGLSRGDGHFGIVASQPGDFASRSHEAGVRAVVGDFDRDGRIDVALTGNPFWNAVPMARSSGGGSYAGRFLPIQQAGVWDVFPIRAWVTGSTWEPFANRCAADPVGSLRSLTPDPGYVMGYRSGSDEASAWAPTTATGMEHRQGIQRLNRNGVNYFAVSMSTQAGTAAGLEITALGSRGPTLYAMGGNVMPFQLAPATDAVRAYLGEASARNHASGFQIAGEYAIQPLEAVNDSVTAGFRIVRLSDPTRPVWSTSTGRVRGHTTDAGAASLVRLQSGRFMALVFGNDSDNVEVFVSTLAEMPGFSDNASQWQSMSAVDTPFGASDYQNIQVVSDCGGQMYIVGTHRHWDSENDWADIWRLDVSDSYVPSFTKLGNFNAKCRTGNTGNERYCDFAAGAGVYVDGSGKLVLYGVEHYNDGVPGTTRGVKVREFN